MNMPQFFRLSGRARNRAHGYGSAIRTRLDADNGQVVWRRSAAAGRYAAYRRARRQEPGITRYRRARTGQGSGTLR